MASAIYSAILATYQPETIMTFHRVTFTDQTSIIVRSDCSEEAQEVAIEMLEGYEIVHAEIASIVQSDAPEGSQFIGMTRDGFACYIGVSL
jgi:hypothetical protein